MRKGDIHLFHTHVCMSLHLDILFPRYAECSYFTPDWIFWCIKVLLTKKSNAKRKQLWSSNFNLKKCLLQRKRWGEGATTTTSFIHVYITRNDDIGIYTPSECQRQEQIGYHMKSNIVWKRYWFKRLWPYQTCTLRFKKSYALDENMCLIGGTLISMSWKNGRISRLTSSLLLHYPDFLFVVVPKRGKFIRR